MKHVEIAVMLAACAACCSTSAAEPALRWSAPITVPHAAALVTLPLPASAYGYSLAPGLADLRVVDATGQRVPFAFLPQPQAESRREEQSHPAAAYPLPRRAAPGSELASPIEVVVQGDSIRVRSRSGPTGEAATRSGVQSPGWLFDLGERKPGHQAPQLLRLMWSGPAEFSAAFDMDTSDTLRDWRGAGSGQVMALASPSGALVQRDVPLPANAPRFIRLVWRHPTTVPQVSGAQAIDLRQSATEQEPPEIQRIQPGPPAPEPAGRPAALANALYFDLGGSLPLSAIDLQLPVGTRVAPVRLQARQRADEAWRELGSWVFYRMEWEGTTSQSPEFTLTGPCTVRYVRVLPDERAGPLQPAGIQLVVKAHLAKLVFASQGQPPYRLLAGAEDAPNGALPIETLVPQLKEERPRLGGAQLGEWTEVAAVADRALATARLAAMRPWLLWGVLVAGVAGLGAMVWALARGRSAAPADKSVESTAS